MDTHQRVAKLQAQPASDRRKMLEAMKVGAVAVERYLNDPKGDHLTDLHLKQIDAWALGHYGMTGNGLEIFTDRPAPPTLQQHPTVRVEHSGVRLDPFEPNMPMLRMDPPAVKPTKRKTQIEEMADLKMSLPLYGKGAA